MDAAGMTKISIHAAREGGDEVAKYGAAVAVISIHAAREGGDRDVFRRRLNPWRFQSTPPVKAATCCPPQARRSRCISIHAAREGGDTDGSDEYARIMISIHAARDGGDAAFECSFIA